MGNSPFFSIIVPIYNTPIEYFETCMTSLINQHYDQFEILLVDDGSKAECADLCDQFAGKDDRIKVIHQKNQGVSAARNNGIEAAEGDWILFVDADDWLEENATERLREYLSETDCDILLFSAVKEYSEKQEALNHGFVDKTLYQMSDANNRELFYRRAMGANNNKSGKTCIIYYSCDKAYRRDFLIVNNLRYPVGIPKSEDKVFILSCFEKMKSLYYIAEPLYHYRINDASVCNRYSDSADRDRIALSKILLPIAKRMDAELSAVKGVTEFNGIEHEFYRFMFGIISDVLLLKYYHPDYIGGRYNRHRDAMQFIRTEPFRSSIRECKYGELTRDAQIKKLLLSNNMVGTFCMLKRLRQKASGAVAESG